MDSRTADCHLGEKGATARERFLLFWVPCEVRAQMPEQPPRTRRGAGAISVQGFLANALVPPKNGLQRARLRRLGRRLRDDVPDQSFFVLSELGIRLRSHRPHRS